QEKWMAMHYRSLGVPVSIGVGATIDFLAGQVRRAPRCSQLSGVEWIFRLLQEPRRLFRRYLNDLWIFGFGILFQYVRMRLMSPGAARTLSPTKETSDAQTAPPLYQIVALPDRLDYQAVRQDVIPVESFGASKRDYVLDMSRVQFIDSTGMGALIRLKK